MKGRELHERKVLEQVINHGGFSIFWVTENQMRACAATRLCERGVLKRRADDKYPWCAYDIDKTKLERKI